MDCLLDLIGSLAGQPHGVIAVLDWEGHVVGEVQSFHPAGQAPKPLPPDLVPGASLDSTSIWAKVARSGEAVFGPPETWLPLPGRHQAQGVMRLDFEHTHLIADMDEQVFLLSLSALGGQALDRAVALGAQQVAQATLTERTRQLEERNLELHGLTQTLAENFGDPLERIHGFLKLAESDPGEDLPVRVRRLFTLVRLEAEMLTKRTDELRTLIQMDQQPLRMETINLSRMLLLVRRDLEPLTRRRTVAWEIGEVPDVLGDARLLYQALLELLAFVVENTWTHPEPRVRISAQVPDGHVVVTIWNSGEGVSEDAQDRLFEVLDRTVMRSTALGRLGLSNVRRVIVRHGGWIRASSPPEGGLAFVLTLPRPAAERAIPLV